MNKTVIDSLINPSDYYNKYVLQSDWNSDKVINKWLLDNPNCIFLKLVSNSTPFDDKLLKMLYRISELKYLECSDCMIVTIDFISDLVDLVWLNLANNKINDLTNLCKLTNLTSLCLKYNNIMDITQLTNTNLVHLDLSNNKLTDINGIQELKQLVRLNLDFNYINDLTYLSKLTKLKVLSLVSNHISDITILGNLYNLESLAVDYNGITDISPLANLTNLTNLSCTNNKICSVVCLVHASKLEKLDCTDNKLDLSTNSLVPRSLDDLQYIRANPAIIKQMCTDVVKQYINKYTYAVIKTENNIKSVVDWVVIPEDYDMVLKSLSIYVYDQETYNKISPDKILLGTYAIKSSNLNYRVIELGRPYVQTGWFYNEIKSNEKLLYTIELVEANIDGFVQ